MTFVLMSCILPISYGLEGPAPLKHVLMEVQGRVTENHWQLNETHMVVY